MAAVKRKNYRDVGQVGRITEMKGAYGDYKKGRVTGTFRCC